MHLGTEIKGLSFTFGDDGVWMNTSANGKHTSINLSNYGKEGGAIMRGLLEWCKETSEHYRKEQANDKQVKDGRPDVPLIFSSLFDRSL